MIKMQCSNCGGRINPNTMRCEYCGTQYKKEADERIIKVETFQNPIKVYKTQMTVPREHLNGNEETMSKIVINQLARNLADAFAENMEVHSEYDPMLNGYRITSRVRIVEPKHIF